MSDDEDSEFSPAGSPHTWKKRRVTWVDRATGLGAIVAIAATITGALAYGFDALPFAKAADVKILADRVNTVERGLHGINLGQKETQELQLMDRVQSLDDRLAKMKPDAEDYQDFRSQRNQTAQRLDQVRGELVMQRANPNGP